MSNANKRKSDGNENYKRTYNKRRNRNGELTISEDCLKYMLKELTLDKLLNAVKLDERLLPMAREVYKGPITDQHFSNKHEPERESILEYFGDQITTLELKFEDDYHCFNGRIEKLINEKCCKTLEEICLRNAGRFALSAIDKPFEKVSTFRIWGHKFSNFIEDFDKWFPAVFSLGITHLEFQGLDDEKFPGHCPELRCFYIENLSSKNENSSYEEKIADFISMNKQLKVVNISNQRHIDKLLSLIAEKVLDCPNLKLSIELNEDSGPEHAKFKYLDELEIQNMGFNIDISTDNVNKLQLEGKSITGYWLNLIAKNRNTFKICLKGKWENGDIIEKIIVLLKSLPNLNEICFPYHKAMTTLQFVGLLNGCKNVKKVYVGASHLDENHTAVKKIANIIPHKCPKWKMDVVKNLGDFKIPGLSFEKSE